MREAVRRASGVGRSCVLVAALWAGGALIATPGVAGTVRGGAAVYSIAQLMSVPGYESVSLAPDGSKLLVSSKQTGLENLYTVPANGGALVAITHSTKETIAEIGYFPTDERILYTADQGGNELYHIYVRNLDGSVRDLTPGPGHKSEFVSWAPDGRYFYLVTNERDPRFFDLYRYDARTYARQRIFDNDAAYQIEAVSPDGARVALSRIVDNATTLAYLYDTRTKALTLITPATHGVTTVPRAFTADGDAVLYTTDRDAQFQYLVRQDLGTGTRRTVFKSAWDVDQANISPDGRYLVVRTNQDAQAVIHFLDARTYKVLLTPDIGPAAVEDVTLARNAPLAAMILSDGNTPGDVYLLDLRSGRMHRLLDSLDDRVAKRDLVIARHVRFKSYDRLPIPGLLYIPHGARVGDHRAAVIWVHGGPGWQSRVGFDPLIEYLVNHGYVCYQINNRGSIGDGKTFYHMDDHKHGDVDLDDVVASKAMLVGTGYVDPDRIAIAGESYGGYMVLAGLTFRPKAFAAGVDLFGVSNWLELLRNTPPWWTDLNRLLATEMGDYRTEQAYFRSISPYYHAKQIRRPLLVLQGANDPRVKPVESQSIVDEVRANHVPVQHVVFPDEGHGFRKSANQLKAYATIRAFLDQYVRSRPSGAKPRVATNPLEMGQ